MTDMLDGSVIRMFRLTNGPGEFGLSCNPDGLFLAGVPLLRRTQAGFVSRPTSEIASLIKAAYGADGDPSRLQSSLGLIARSLNGEDFALAAIAAVQTRTPELSREAASRLMNVDKQLTKRNLTKFDPDEPRDWHGRWTTAGAAGSTGIPTSAGEGASNQRAGSSDLHASNPEQDGADRNASLIPVAYSGSNDDSNSDHSQQPTTLEQEFEAKYDDLGPVDFAKKVIQFGDWLGREGANLSPEEKERALAEYSFLQNRLSFWLGYDYKPAIAQGNLISAAQTLYQGAINGGIVQVGNLPRSMLDVAGTGAFFTDGPPRIRPSTKPAFEDAPNTPAQAPNDVEGVGAIAPNSEAEIKWKGGIKQQGLPWEDYVTENYPGASKLKTGQQRSTISMQTRVRP